MSAVIIVGCVVGGLAVLMTGLLVLIILKRPREYVGDGKFE